MKHISNLADLSFSTIYVSNPPSQVMYDCGHHPVTNSVDKNNNSDENSDSSEWEED